MPLPIGANNSATLRDLSIALSERVGKSYHGATGTGAAAMPEDAHLRDKLIRYVNRGYADLMRAIPTARFLTVPIRLTIDQTGTRANSIGGDSGRYRLPAFVSSQPTRDWRYVGASTISGTICRRSAHDVVTMREQYTETTGTPEYAAVRAYTPADPIGGQSRGFELVLYPNPDRAYVIEGDFRVRDHILADLDERPVSGRDHDETILAAAVYAWKLDTESPNLAAFKRDRDEALARSIELDGLNAEPTLGNDLAGPDVAREAFVLDSYNGVSIWE